MPAEEFVGAEELAGAGGGGRGGNGAEGCSIEDVEGAGEGFCEERGVVKVVAEEPAVDLVGGLVADEGGDEAVAEGLFREWGGVLIRVPTGGRGGDGVERLVRLSA